MIVESDYQVLVNRTSNEDDRSEISSILKEVKELSRKLISFQCNFVRRPANFGAHLCAENPGADRQRCAWINMVSSFLINCLRHDCFFLNWAKDLPHVLIKERKECLCYKHENTNLLLSQNNGP